ncbi:MAG: polysaccharide deacetylase family protein [Chloroflexi bacterium]|nr:polysaccharide deacetylase family protein [Chloroflexota bacterium]
MSSGGAFDTPRPGGYHPRREGGETLEQLLIALGRGRRATAVLAAAFVVVSGLVALRPGSKLGRELWIMRSAPTVTPSATLVPTSTASPSPTRTSTSTATPTTTFTPTPSNTPTATASATATISPTPSVTPSPTQTPTPQPTPDGTPRALVVPILMYHYLSAPPAGADAIRRDLSVSPAQFEEHLQALRAGGYTAITLYDLTLALQIGATLPDRPIVITFDDGYRDNYVNALPLLQRYGFVATFFLITGLIDEGRAEYVTWEQVIEMHQAGMEIGAHGYSHVDLRGRDVDYLVWQMLGSKEAIEARIGEPVRFFCYPSGKYDALGIQVLKSAHYWGAVTVHPGVRQRSEAMYELSRVRVHGDTDAPTLLAALDAWVRQERRQGAP